MVEAVSWDRPFAEPIELPKGKKLVTLRDAALYITKLPKVEHDAEEWQAAMAAQRALATPTALNAKFNGLARLILRMR
jgi:hypothetical protein